MLEFFTIFFIILLAAISPGPDFVIVSSNALRYSQKVGIATALGIATSTLIHSTYCILGLAYIISKSLLVFSLIKYVGSAYLIYLGIKGLLEKQTSRVDAVGNDIVRESFTSTQAFRQGFFCNALNPKCIFFFIALFTMVIKPSMHLALQAGIAIEIALIHFIWFSFVSILFSHQKVKSFLSRFMYHISKFFGGVLIIFGLKIATLANK